MKQLVIALAALVSTSAFAQEIGTEITPATPTSAAQNPPPPPPQDQAAQPNTRAQASKKDAAVPAGSKVSAGSGDFGIRASLVGASAVAAPAASAAVTVTAPTIGFSIFASDSFKLLIDVGVGFATQNSSVALAFDAGIGFDYLFRTPADALRPFVHVSANFTLGGALSFPDLGAGLRGGFGAEYFFSPNFSVNGKLLLGIPMKFSPVFRLDILTLAPGVGATWYF